MSSEYRATSESWDTEGTFMEEAGIPGNGQGTTKEQWVDNVGGSGCRGSGRHTAGQGQRVLAKMTKGRF